MVVAEGQRPTTLRDWTQASRWPERDLLTSQLTGAMLGMQLFSNESGKKLYCVPADTHQDGGLATIVLNAYAQSHPDGLDQPLLPVLISAMKEVFPCKEEDRER